MKARTSAAPPSVYQMIVTNVARILRERATAEHMPIQAYVARRVAGMEDPDAIQVVLDAMLLAVNSADHVPVSRSSKPPKGRGQPRR